MANYLEHLFSRGYLPSLYPCRWSVYVFCLSLMQYLFYCYWVLRVFSIFWNIWFAHIFPAHGLSFHFCNGVSWNNFFYKVQLIFFFLSWIVLLVSCLQILCLTAHFVPGHKDFLLCFPLKVYSWLRYKSLAKMSKSILWWSIGYMEFVIKIIIYFNYFNFCAAYPLYQ